MGGAIAGKFDDAHLGWSEDDIQSQFSVEANRRPGRCGLIAWLMGQ
jgi:hypothetical protein